MAAEFADIMLSASASEAWRWPFPLWRDSQPSTRGPMTAYPAIAEAAATVSWLQFV
jgi:hypothetical protein